MPPQIPTSTNAQYYANGRGLAHYQGQRPLAVDSAPGTPIWWSKGVKDAWADVPSRTGTEPVWLDNGGGPRQVIGGPEAAANPWTNAPQTGPAQAPAYRAAALRRINRAPASPVRAITSALFKASLPCRSPEAESLLPRRFTGG